MWGENPYSERVDRAGRRVLSVHASFSNSIAVTAVVAAVLGFLAYDLTPRLPYAASVALGIVVFAVISIIGYLIAGSAIRTPLLQIVIDRRGGTLTFGRPQQRLRLADIDHAELSAIELPRNENNSYVADPHERALYRLDLVMRSRARISVTPSHESYGVDVFRRLLAAINRDLQASR